MIEGTGDDKSPAVVIAGPTTSGKSGLALALAERLPGTVINADSMQVYREFRILTARPGPDAERLVPHRLYGIVPATKPCSAARWRELALLEMDAARDAGRIPILAGGTGLYLRALMDGIADIPEVPAEVRETAVRDYEELGGEAFRTRLVRVDPISARLPPGDRQRLIRAWEVWAATGRPITDWQQATVPSADGWRFLTIVVMPPRPALYAACNGRFLAMIDAGALEEAAAVDALSLDPGLPAMKVLGFPELRDHIRGAVPLETAIALGQQSTRRYAKRQVTWFRHQVLEPYERRADRPCLLIDGNNLAPDGVEFDEIVRLALSFVLGHC